MGIHSYFSDDYLEQELIQANENVNKLLKRVQDLKENTPRFKAIVTSQQYSYTVFFSNVSDLATFINRSLFGAEVEVIEL